MLGMLSGFAGVIGLAFLYFIGAIPAGVALGLPVPAAALAACIGYTCGGIVVALLGAPVRDWIVKRFGIRLEPDPTRLFWRAWNRFGLVGLSLLAPVTVGPQVAALIGLGLGVPSAKLVLAIAAGVIPWAVAISVLLALGFRLVS